MEFIEPLDRIILGLPLAERLRLLERFKDQLMATAEPLYTADEDDSDDEALKKQYAYQPWWLQLWVLLHSFLKARPPEEVFEEMQVKRLGRQIEKHSPGLYSFKRRKLLPLFYHQLEKLKDAAHFFYSALDAGFNQDKGAFYSFLGSLEMPDIHDRLEAGMDISSLAAVLPGAAERELHQMVNAQVDDALTSLSPEIRSAMYFNVRYLFCLKKLASFPFDLTLRSFINDPYERGPSCYANVVSDLLIPLNDILYSLKAIPPISLLESLFVFLFRKRGQSADDITEGIESFLVSAEDILQVIRDFNKQVLLTKILRCTEQNISLSPKEVTGGEDWFAVYRDYWKHRIEDAFSRYIKERRRQELLQAYSQFLKEKEFHFLKNVYSEENQEGIPVKGALGLSLLLTFCHEVFAPSINRYLEPILLEGEFYNNAHRITFTEAYHNALDLEESIVKFEEKLSSQGSYGKRYAMAKSEASIRLQQRKIKPVIDDVTSEADGILSKASKSFQDLDFVLNGIARDNFLMSLPKAIGHKRDFFHALLKCSGDFQKADNLLQETAALGE